MPIKLNQNQSLAINTLISVFETGRIDGNSMYSQVVYNPHDSGGLSYGKYQASLNSGNLFLLIKGYCTKNPKDGQALVAFLDRLGDKDTSLNTDQHFIAALIDAGSISSMQSAQDLFFSTVFLSPALSTCNAMGMTTPLSVGVVYDSFIQGAFNTIMTLANAQGSFSDIGEVQWIKNYLNARLAWFASNANPLLKNCVYRPQFFLDQIDKDNWTLALPFLVHGVSVTNLTLANATHSYNATVNVAPVDKVSVLDSSPLLMLKNPAIANPLVWEVQNALVSFGYPVTVDSLFGVETDSAVRLFQQSHNLFNDGIIGPATSRALGL
jgi:chitosanase